MFESKPFIVCPSCQEPASFGVLMVNNDRYLRRCIKCKHKQQYPLPPLNKKVLLLDQFVFSNMAKALMPESKKKRQNAELTYYRHLFGKIDRLFKMQTIICPFTDMHDHESYVADEYDSYKLIWEHLSSGDRLKHADSIFYSQVWYAFKNWVDPHGENDTDTYYEDFRRKINCWMDRIRIGFNAPFMDDLKTELSRNKVMREKGLSEVFKCWKNEKHFQFKDWFQQEVHGVRITMQNAFTNRLKAHQRAIESQGKDIDSYIGAIGDQKAQLVQDMISFFQKQGKDTETCLKSIGEFLRSPAFEEIPMIRTQSALWAGLAHQICHGNMNPPTQSISNDFEFIAAYLPYVDAIFVDKQCYTLLTQNPVREFINTKTKIFSLHKRDEFKDYLSEIESSTPEAHKQKVEEVYGDTWLEPYYDIIKDQLKVQNAN